MIAVYPFCLRDQKQALKNVRWFNELGGCKGHQVVCCYDPRCDAALVEKIGEELRQAFDKVWRLPAAEMDGWPEGANYLFRFTATWLQSKPEWTYFLWLEPDAIPITPGWMDKLEAEYKQAGKPFMGDRVEVEDIPLHMSGIGIYQNPIYAQAGEAYRAHDIAWDMAAKDQIVPNAHFTDLIEHAWKHPTFHYQSEIATQIAPETILFHSSKDGSLIDLLQKKTAPDNLSGGLTAVQPLAVEARPIADAAQPICDIFIRTYPGDYEWLKYCLRAIDKFAIGFRKVWIVSPQECPFDPVIHNRPAEWKQMNDETEDGYLAQQITKLYADVITDYQPDYILHVDSDVIFTKPTTPGDFLFGDKVTWFYTPFDQIQTPWQPILEKFMGFPQPFEFMRRLPMMIPRWLYPRLREFAHHLHGVPIGDYIKAQPQRAFSEFNALGAYAYFHHKDRFTWMDTSTIGNMPKPVAHQFHSWGGLTPEIKSRIERLLGGMGEKVPKDAPPVPSQIKELPSGVWVLQGDQISQWVEQEGRLDHDQNLLPDILKHIRPGDCVVDAGAFIGDHTVAYSHAVGDEGAVHAFEPNPNAYQCLSHNLLNHHARLYAVALGDQSGVLVPLSGNNGNWGGAYVGEHMKIGNVMMRQLDDYPEIMPDFIKIDVEGSELKVLHGAQKMITRHQPKMVIEVNREALGRQAASPEDLFAWLKDHDYEVAIIQENCSWSDPLYDILCLPREKPPENSKVATAHNSTAPSPVATLSTTQTMQQLIDQLRKIADESPKNKGMVAARLVYAGLRPAAKKKAKKK